MSFIELVKSDGLPENEFTHDYAAVHKKSMINLDVKPPVPPTAISIGIDDIAYNGHHYPLRFGTYGNISMIKGEEKSRKTWLKSMIISGAIGGNSNLLAGEIKGHSIEGKYIIDIDTEQDSYDAWMVADRVKRMVGAIPQNYIPVMLREYSAAERMEYLDWLFTKSPYKDKLGIVSIDGYVDMIQDFNSLSESIEFTQKLMKYSTISKCHITGILHLNPNTEKARGHLGTILQQKCETVVIIKDAGDFSEVTCQRARGKKFSPFAIGVNSDRLPYVLEGALIQSSAKENKPRAEF
ncbi:hypothetical protein Q765_03190 [Flavobacterium rivuli WB 3.3-2 = DSM 21788]|uniref:Uncharacterized protein n=1 Tax=Flavobacterium rivuli WB 3.3-2 = DSM 21788 TaxID=1121895 RepID=A0A0A2MIC4_9FLAO|nr:hypothetical protein [Flavobacterium rivuli]KGO88075.1 hypothetical protein Q765_03190 [Flavobacterium rivuli WB 3.3-2 = DSM 21788]